MDARIAIKLGLLGFGAVLVLMGILSLLQPPPVACTVIFIFPLWCSIPNLFWWVGGLVTAIIGLGLVLIGLRS